MADYLRHLFAANHTIILAVYGQAFFVLGLAIALQSWRHSRLVLARSLNWLAAFGFVHAFYEWGDIFIPLQAGYLPNAVIGALRSGQAILLAVSFACLLQFGIETLRPLPAAWRWLRVAAALLLAGWTIWSYGLPPITGASALRPGPIISARYFLGLPGGLLAAYGLARQAGILEREIGAPDIAAHLRIAGLTLAGYALLAGLIAPPAGFFPANILNMETVEAAIVVPVPLLRSVLGLVLTIAIIRTLEVFHVELDRRFADMEEAQVLAGERDRIGRELHDGMLQTIYAAGLLLQAAASGVRNGESTPETQFTGHLRKSMDLLDQAVGDIRGYIGGLEAEPNSEGLSAGLQALASDYGLRSVAEIAVRIDLPQGCPLAPARIGHLLAIAREALSNVARHARATQVSLTAEVIQGNLHLQVCDNGQGLAVDHQVGYGLRNMRDRTRLLGGQLQFGSQAGHGTSVHVIVPWCTEEAADAALATG